MTPADSKKTIFICLRTSSSGARVIPGTFSIGVCERCLSEVSMTPATKMIFDGTGDHGLCCLECAKETIFRTPDQTKVCTPSDDQIEELKKYFIEDDLNQRKN